MAAPAQRDGGREWTSGAARMARGRLIGEVTSPYAPPVDTGEAVGSRSRG
jgi:hypothetical protein